MGDSLSRGREERSAWGDPVPDGARAGAAVGGTGVFVTGETGRHPGADQNQENATALQETGGRVMVILPSASAALVLTFRPTRF